MSRTAKKSPSAKALARKEKQEEAENSSHLWTMLATATDGASDRVLGLFRMGERKPRGYDEDAFQRDTDEDRFSRVWKQPRETSASRPVTRSKHAIRGSTVNDADYRRMVLDSNLERDVLSVLQTDPRIAEIREQAPPQTVVDENGEIHEHTFDVLLTLTDGTRIAMAVKPETMRESSGIDKIVGCFRAQNDGSFADRFVVRSREHFTRDQVYNARLILWARRLRVPEHCEVLKAFLLRVVGTTKLSDVIEAAGLDLEDGFVAATCLLDEGFLEASDNGRFHHGSPVRPATLN